MTQRTIGLESQMTARAHSLSGFVYLYVLFYILMEGAPGIAYRKILFPIMALLVMVYLFAHNSLFREKDIWRYVIANLVIFACQWITLGWVSLPGVVNYSCKIIWGAFLYVLLGYQFKYVYLRLMSFIALISLVFFGIQSFTGIRYEFFDTGPGLKFYSLILYCSREGELARNCGCFWEPGAYGCYLMMIPIFFVNELPKLWREHRIKCIILVAALLTTRSTTAYLTFGMFVLIFLVLKMRSWVKYLIIPVALIGALAAYESLEFLQEKVDKQTESSIAARGEYNANRLGSLLFDWHYIKKHPFFGNGLHERTRYADHPGLAKALKDGDLAKSGNGLSGHCANMGVVFYLVFYYFLFRRNRRLTLNERLMIVIIFSMLLCGEALFNYPLSLALCFHVWYDPEEESEEEESVEEVTADETPQIEPVLS